MLKKSFLLFTSVWLNLILSGCATINPPDIPVCAQMNMERGRCTMTISDKDIVIDEKNLYMGKTWWELRPQMIYLPYPAWVELKTFVIKVCAKNLVKCDESIKSWDRKVYYFDGEEKRAAELLP